MSFINSSTFNLFDILYFICICLSTNANKYQFIEHIFLVLKMFNNNWRSLFSVRITSLWFFLPLPVLLFYCFFSLNNGKLSESPLWLKIERGWPFEWKAAIFSSHVFLLLTIKVLFKISKQGYFYVAYPCFLNLKHIFHIHHK